MALRDGGLCNVALKLLVCVIWFREWSVKYGPESGGLCNMAL